MRCVAVSPLTLSEPQKVIISSTHMELVTLEITRVVYKTNKHNHLTVRTVNCTNLGKHS